MSSSPRTTKNAPPSTSVPLTESLADFREQILAVRRQLEPQPFPWYSYDILANVGFIDRLLLDANLSLADLTAGRPVLDIGCADGDLAFFLETLGCAVTAVDHPSTNANGMQAVCALRAGLHSSVDVLEANVDQGFVPPQGANYGLAVMLGILYHLKNPYLVLESLAKYANYCLLSTRVARFAPGGTPLHNIPVAYLLDPGETNNDITNYWILSNPGLKRLIRRTGWEICSYLNIGNSESSDPVTAQGDERAFCLLVRSDAFTNGKLLHGWYDPAGERDGWRWTADSFAIECFVGWPGKDFELELQVYLGEAQLAATGQVRITISVNGKSLPNEILKNPGVHVIRRSIPSVQATGTLRFDFTASPTAPGGLDPRILGIVVNSIKLRPSL